MRTLKSTLIAVLPDPTSLGGDNRNVDRTGLVAALEGLARELHNSIWLRFAVMIVVVCVSAITLFKYGNHPTLSLGIWLGMAVLLLMLLTHLREITDELARVRLLLTVAQDVSLESLTEISRRLTLLA